MTRRRHRVLFAVFLFTSISPVYAEEAKSIRDAIRESKWIVDMRLRAEEVDQADIANDASAITFRARFGAETDSFWRTSLLAEGEAVVSLDDRYRPDPLDSYNAQYPVVADPESFGFNRLFLENTSLPDTVITLGRQRILLDDQRFVGNVGWRQNEQTVDALRIVNRSLERFIIDASLLNRVSRVFGEDSPQGTYRGNGALLNAAYEAKVGLITAFGYLLEFDSLDAAPAAAGDSTTTWGLRLDGEVPMSEFLVSYLASWANQADAGDNPQDFDLDHAALEIAATYKSFRVGIGTEVLEGNGAKGFTTPLATLHKFQGWADKFLTTPPNGIEDTCISASYDLGRSGALDSLAFVAAFHDYRSEQAALDYGSEWNVSVGAKLGRFNFMLKYADFREGVLSSARDTTKYWIQVEYIA